MSEGKIEHHDRGLRAAKVQAAWAVLLVLSAVVFAWCFQFTYTAVLERARDWEFEIRMSLQGGSMPEHPYRESHIDPPESRLQDLRVWRGLFTYSATPNVDPASERTFKRLAKTYGLAAVVFVLLCLPVAWLMLWFARARMRLGSLENEEQAFQLGIVVRLAVPLLLFAAVGGAWAAAGLTATRLLQIRYQPEFNAGALISERVTFDRDYLGRAVATLISCAAMLAIVTWGLYPFFARRTLRELCRCAKCAYPRGDNTKCPECGSSHA